MGTPTSYVLAAEEKWGLGDLTVPFVGQFVEFSPGVVGSHGALASALVLFLTRFPPHLLQEATSSSLAARVAATRVFWPQ